MSWHILWGLQSSEHTEENKSWTLLCWLLLNYMTLQKLHWVFIAKFTGKCKWDHKTQPKQFFLLIHSPCIIASAASSVGNYCYQWRIPGVSQVLQSTYLEHTSCMPHFNVWTRVQCSGKRRNKRYLASPVSCPPGKWGDCSNQTSEILLWFKWTGLSLFYDIYDRDLIKRHWTCRPKKSIQDHNHLCSYNLHVTTSHYTVQYNGCGYGNANISVIKIRFDSWLCL